MIICNSCKQSNIDDSYICSNCGHTLLQFDCISGMPLLAGSCQDQVLNMRYIIESEILRDQAGCVYKAEDAYDGSKVVIKTLPLSVELNQQQIDELSRSVNSIVSLFPQGLNHLKGFEYCDLVRYFVYDCDVLSDSEGAALVNIQGNLAEQLALEAAAKNNAEAKLNEHILELQALKKQLETDKQTYNEIIQKARQEHLEQQSDNERIIAELKSVIEIQKTKIQIAQASHDEQISQIKNALNSQKDLSDEALKEADNKIELLEAEQKQAIELHTKQYEDYKNQLACLQEKLEAQKASFDHQQTQNTELSEQISLLNATLIEKENKLKELTEQIDGLKESQHQYKQQLESSKSEHESKVNQLRQDTAEKQTQAYEQLQQAQIKIDTLSTQLEQSLVEKEQSVKQSQEKISDYDNQIETLKQQTIKSKNESALQLQQAHDKVEFLSARLDEVLTEKEKAASEYEEKLKQLQNTIGEQDTEKQKHQTVEADYQNTIEQLKTQLSKLTEEYDVQLEKANHQIVSLSNSLEKTEQLLNQARQESQPESEAVEKIKDEALKQRADYMEQLDKANWKIKALSKELNRLLDINKKSSVSYKPASKFKFPTAISATAMAAGLLAGIGLSYFHANYKSKERPWQQEQVIALSNEFKNEVQKGPEEETIDKTDSLARENELESVFEKEIKRLDEFYSSKLTKETARVYLKAAQKGDVQAMYKLGMAYLHGNGTEKSINKAILWLSRAADNENAEALLELGNMYYLGTDITRDRPKALEYYVKASEAGNSLATYNVGRIHQEDAGVQAVRWYQEAAKQGLPKAMNQLAQMYYIGTFVKQDIAKSVEYYELSAQHGDTKAMYNLASFYQGGIGVEKDVRQAMLWLIKAARMGDADSMYQLGVLFESGAGIQQDIEKALYWYQTASDSGHQKAPQKLIELKKTS